MTNNISELPPPPDDEEIAAVLEYIPEAKAAFAAGNYTTKEDMLRMFEEIFGQKTCR